MAFQKPETLEGLSISELKSLRGEALAEAREINAKEELSSDEVARLNEIMDIVEELDGAATVIEAEVAAAAGARDRLSALEESDEDEGDEEDGDEDPDGEASETPEGAEVLEPVLAGGRKVSTVAKAASRAPKAAEQILEENEKPFGGLTLIAAANVPDVQAGQDLVDMRGVAGAFLNRMRTFGGTNVADMKPAVYQMSANASRYGVARLGMPENEFTIGEKDSAEVQFETIMAAAKESRLPGGSLVAAAGWCAPSEQIWGFCELETREGLLDIPEITARRGGVSFTKGPSLADLLADSDFGFLQTEAVVEEGETPKVCYAIDCDNWTEVRLDAIGFCITAGLLTNAAYPELVRRVLNLAGIGFARKLNADTIGRISTAIGAAVTWAPVTSGSNSATSDVLEGLELQALRIRQTNAMSPTATIEGIAPYWFKAVLRADLSRRLGLPSPMAVSDQDVVNFLSIRGIRLQFVYDYQMLNTTNTSTWTTYPSTVDVMLYPAGAYVRLTSDVISLDAVHDKDSLTKNQYTAAFFEQGTAIANTCGGGVKVTFALNRLGSSGFPRIGSGEGVTIPVAE